MSGQNTKFYSLEVSELDHLTDDAVMIKFIIPDELKKTFHYDSGQYINIKKVVQDEEVRRSYSLCSSPFENTWAIGVKKVKGGVFSSYAKDNLKKGEILEVMPPQGNFLLPKEIEPNNVFLFFAAGSGITPIISQIKFILQNSEASVMLFFGNSNTESIMFREELEGLKNQYLNRLSLHYILSRENPGSALFYGRINKKKCLQFATYFFNVEEVKGAYICGPFEMIEEVKVALVEKGMHADAIHFELFHAPDKAINIVLEKEIIDTSSMSLVTLSLDGLTFDFPLPFGGKSILDAALENGADLPFACKGGVCSTCKAKLKKGEVHMTVNYALEQSEIDAGYILTCQSHPRTPQIIVDFDA